MERIEEIAKGEFLEVTKGAPHNGGEIHYTHSRIYSWLIDGDGYEEHQDLHGKLKWYKVNPDYKTSGLFDTSFPMSAEDDEWKTLSRNDFWNIIQKLHNDANEQYDGTSLSDYDDVEFAGVFVDVAIKAWKLCGFEFSDEEKTAIGDSNL